MVLSNDSILQNVVNVLPDSVNRGFQTILFLGKIVLLIILIYLIIKIFSSLIKWYREHKEAKRIKTGIEILEVMKTQLDELISVNRDIRDMLIKKKPGKDKDKKKE